MKAIVLAAGFGERLRPLTEKTPKSLLEVGAKPIIDHLLDFLFKSPAIDTVHIRTNQYYYSVFKEWLKKCPYIGKVELSSNGIDRSAEKLGALGDLENICSTLKVNEDVIVVAADNIFDFDIEPFLEFSTSKDGDVVTMRECGDDEMLKGGGVVEITSQGRVIDFKEKPSDPRTNLAALPLYYLSTGSIQFLKKYIMEGNDTDNMGSFLQWSYRRRPLYVFKVEGMRYHISDIASYENVLSMMKSK